MNDYWPMSKMNKEKIIAKMQEHLSLTEPEATAYYLLLEQDLSASTLAEALRINRSYVYGMLKKLVSRGFCIEISDTVRKYRAIEPSLAFEATMDELSLKIDFIKKLESTLTPIFEARSSNAKNEMIKVLHSRAHILDTLSKYEAEANTEVLAFSKPPYLMDVENLEVSCQSQNKSTERGVRHRTVYEIDHENENFLKLLRFGLQSGEDVRVAKYLPMKFVIFDHQRIIFTLGKNPGKNNDSTFTFMDDSNLAKTISLIFEMYWESSMTYDEYKMSLESTNAKEGEK